VRWLSLAAVQAEANLGQRPTAAPANFGIDVLDVEASDNVRFTIDDKTMTGSGSVTDYTGVAMGISETVLVSFSASCS